MVTRARIEPGDGDPRHGTGNGYSNLRCRCDACRRAQRDRVLAWRSNAPDLAPGDPRHGTDNGYTNWLCSCESCRAANAARSSMTRKRRITGRT